MSAQVSTNQFSALRVLASVQGEATHRTAKSLGVSPATLNALVKRGLAERVDTYDVDMTVKGHYAITEVGHHVLTPITERPVHVRHETLEQAMAAVDFHGYEINNVGIGYTSNCYGEALTFGYSDDIEQYVLEHDGEVIFTSDSPAMLLGCVARDRASALAAVRDETAPLPVHLMTNDHYAFISDAYGTKTSVANMYTLATVTTIFN